MPPIAGLQDICAIRSRFMVMIAVFRPMRAAAMAASQPACPAPTTATSNCSVNDIALLFYGISPQLTQLSLLLSQVMRVVHIGPDISLTDVFPIWQEAWCPSLRHHWLQVRRRAALLPRRSQ